MKNHQKHPNTAPKLSTPLNVRAMRHQEIRQQIRDIANKRLGETKSWDMRERLIQQLKDHHD